MAKKWEYKTFSDSLPHDRVYNFTTCFTETALNELGSKGWELVAITSQSHPRYAIGGSTTALLWVFKRAVE